MSDKLHIGIKDFQSLKKADILLTPGITVITGATNNGKSAIIRAIDSAIFNLGDDAMVRGGQRYYGVKISNDIHTMLMARDNVGKNEKTAYQFDDGTVQKKVGRGQLEEVSRMFNIREVKMNNGTKMKINFWYQNDKPFLMDKTAGQLYEFLSLSSCDNYARVLKSLGSDVRSINSDINTLTTEINTYKSLINDKKDFISKNDGFDLVYQEAIDVDAMGDLLSNVEGLLDDVDMSNNTIKKLDNLKLNIDIKISSIDIDSVSALYQDIISLDSEVSSLCELLDYIDSTGGKISQLDSEHKELKSNISTNDTCIKDFSNIINDAECLHDKIDIVSNALVDVEENIKSKDIIDTRLSSINGDLCTSIDDISREVNILDDNFSQLMVIEGCLKELDSSKEVLDSYASKVEDVKSKLSESDIEFEQLKKDIGYCPYCRREFV